MNPQVKLHRIYLSGPITGVPDYQGRFEKAAEEINRALGDSWVIMNPAVLPEGLTTAEYMIVDLQLVKAADFIIMLPGWTESTGAKLEKLFAQYIGVKAYEYEDFMKIFGGHNNG